jgi:two-component system LytT family response regulator
MRLSCVIVDDEPHARSLVREFLGDYDHVEVAGECGNGREAIEMIHETDPDLVFLDVQMPGLDGFDVLERLETVPFIVFATAYDEYALRAFDAGAIDYLRKPFSRDRFETAVDRVTQRYRESRTRSDDARDDAPEEAAPEGDAGAPGSEYIEELAALLQKVRDAERTGEPASGDAAEGSDAPDDAPPAPLTQLYVRRGKKIVPVDVNSIRWIEAAGDYAKLHAEDGTYVTSVGLGELVDRLPGDRFQRLHRSHVVALPAIDHLRSDGSGGYEVRLDDGTSLRVSRSYAPTIRERIV